MKFYETILEAISDLNRRGYTIDFNLRPPFPLAPDKFEITEVHRFEGQTNPDDEGVVYAIESRSGQKGILVNGYGVSADAGNDEMITRLMIRH